MLKSEKHNYYYFKNDGNIFNILIISCFDLNDMARILRENIYVYKELIYHLHIL